MPRQFGGVGLMIEQPGIDLIVERSTRWQAQGPLSERALGVARDVIRKLDQTGFESRPVRIVVRQAPPEHVGLGTGTQLSLALALAIATLDGKPDLDIASLAELSGRGQRSGIGTHGFHEGGLIVDGGHATRGDSRLPPRLVRLSLPENWYVLIAIPPSRPGLHGAPESQAFEYLPPIPETVTDRLCRLLLLGLLPAVVEDDITIFGQALSELQYHVGEVFAPAQGGVYASPEVAELSKVLQREGLYGVGQSSWGPALYGFNNDSEKTRSRLRDRIVESSGLPRDAVFWTRPSQAGAKAQLETDSR